MHKATEPGFLDIAHAATWCCVSQKTVQRWLTRGLRYFQEGPRTKVLIAPEDIRVFLTKRQAERPALDVLVDEVLVTLQS